MQVKRRKKTKFIILGLLIFLIAVGVVGWMSVDRWYQTGLEPVSATVSEQQVVIEQGSTSQDISEQLYNEGLIRNATVFRWYISRTSISNLQAGVYRLSPHLTVEEIVEVIAGGKVDTRFITVIPGLRLDEIEDSLIADGFDPAEVRSALEKSYDHPLFEDVPASASLEGYIFPETVQITSQTTVEELLERYFDTFYNSLTQEVLDGITAQGLTFHEAVILASIIQEEENDPELQRTIAQVFLKRLDEGIVLGADPTFRYAAAIEGVEDSISIDSPYNTRIYGGLTPGPIANFNYSALEAVANPTDTEYLFFVAGDDGNTYFSFTEAEHNANVAEHCIELCQL